MNHTDITATDINLRLDEALRDGAEASSIDIARAFLQAGELDAAHRALLTIEAATYL